MSAEPIPPHMDAVQYLKIARQGAAVATHADLWRWLQGDVQQWLPHQALLVGWGNFRTGELDYDIVSSVPGMRPRDWASARIAPLISYFRDCWVAAQHQPCRVEAEDCESLVAACPDPLALGALRSMKSALVHGIPAGGHGAERIFAALTAESDHEPAAGMALKLLIPFIDTALRQMAPASVRHAPCRADVPRHVARLAVLSERERQIMDWVALGKTNPEIGCILDISEFTVKNHMKSIFSKLDVTNRAQAVAKLSRMSAYA